MERIQRNEKHGIHAGALRTWGMVFAASGIISRSVLQRGLLGMGSISSDELLATMSASEGAMAVATAALVLQVLEACAVPIFAFLMVEGFKKTKDLKNYILRVLGLALASEVPYNLAFSGRILDFSSRNPVFGVVLGLILLGFYKKYAGSDIRALSSRMVATVAAVMWVGMLGIEYGMPTVLIGATLWALRKKPMLANAAGATVSILCSLSSMFLMAAPMGFLAVHTYNGEQGESSRVVNYLVYPALLVVSFLAASLL